MKITEFFVRRPVLFWSLMAAILIAGILSFIQMPKLEDPAVSAKQAMVVVPYPGASAHTVELEVAQMMEEELRAAQRQEGQERMQQRLGDVHRRIPNDGPEPRLGATFRPAAPQGQ